jgi:hypothetical protein
MLIVATDEKIGSDLPECVEETSFELPASSPLQDNFGGRVENFCSMDFSGRNNYEVDQKEIDGNATGTVLFRTPTFQNLSFYFLFKS